jgi:signal transduction histidine kinase
VGSWLIIAVLVVVLVISIGRLFFFSWEVRKMKKQLDEIIENFGTNELVRTTTHQKNLTELTASINQLIHVFKQDQQRTLNKERELKQEITNISHDLRTPLTSIKGFTELLSDSSLSETQKQEFIMIIQKKIDHLTTTVDLFYELSQLDSSDKELEIEKQFLDQIVVETMLLFYEDFEKKEIKVEIEEFPVLPILADKNATERIVANIIQNAIRYAKNYFKLYLFEKDSAIRLVAVNDMDAVNIPEVVRIFDRTVRLDSSRSGTSLGLGLHIVQQLIEKQGGQVTADIQGDKFSIEVSFEKWN